MGMLRAFHVGELQSSFDPYELTKGNHLQAWVSCKPSNPCCLNWFKLLHTHFSLLPLIFSSSLSWEPLKIFWLRIHPPLSCPPLRRCKKSIFDKNLRHNIYMNVSSCKCVLGTWLLDSVENMAVKDKVGVMGTIYTWKEELSGGCKL